jgi:tetraacyldisaccharide 4'-kinase
MKGRNRLFDWGICSEYKSLLPIISVGNLTVGGNGKTPLVIAIAAYLQTQGKLPAIVMRGYGGSEKGPYLVKPHDSALKVGDEALLLQRTLKIPVVVSRKRMLGIKLIESGRIADTIILDDGFQHRFVARDLDLITHYLGNTQTRKDFLKGSVLPFGRFREDRTEGLKRASGIIFASRSINYLEPDRSIEKIIPTEVPIMYSALIFDEIRSVSGSIPLEDIKDRIVVAVCALANPQGFVDTLTHIGLDVATVQTFPDHHNFKIDDILALQDRYKSAFFLTTSKDMVKLAPLLKGADVAAHSKQATDIARWGEVRVRAVVQPQQAFEALVARAARI